MRCAKVCGIVFLIVLIGWAGELQSRGFYCMRKFVQSHAWILYLDGLCSHLTCTWEDLYETALQSSVSKVEGTKCNHD